MEEENSLGDKSCCTKCRQSKTFVIFIVFLALFVDCLLLTVVVPIVPNVLRKFDEERRQLSATSNATIFLHREQDTYQNLTNDNSTASLDNVQLFNTESDQKIEVSLLLASKVLIQLIANPLVGLCCRRFGYSVPMVFGFIVTFVSTIAFGFGNSYWALLVARAIQGFGSSCASVAGLGMLASLYTDDKERGKAMSTALSGMALGVLVGPPYGGVMYEFTGKAIPFIIIAIISLIDGILRLCVSTPKNSKCNQQVSSSMLLLLKDPYVIVVTGGMIVSTLAIAVVEPTLPIWMHEKFGATAWQQGIAFISMTLPYVVGTSLFGEVGNKIGRWLSAIIGLIIIAAGLATLPLANTQYFLIPSLAVLGLAIGMVSSSLFPTMGFLVDIRQLPSYADAYALADACLCLGFLIGPAISGAIFRQLGFHWLMWIIAILNVVYSPLLVFLRNPSKKSEDKRLLFKDEETVHYYGDENISDLK